MIKKTYKLMLTLMLCGITVISTLNFISITSNVRFIPTTQVKKADSHFPIESFVMVTQDLITFQQICNQVNEDCLPIPSPTNKISGTGSGVIIGERDGKSLVITAGHVCAGGRELIPMVEDLNVQYHIELETGYGNQGHATILSIDMINDLCLLISDTHLGPAVPVYNGEPELHEKVYNMASPLGLAVPIAVPVFDGYFAGHVSSLYIFTIPAAPGSSGSPVMNEDGEIISIINAAAISFDEYAIGCKTQALRNFLISNNVF